MKQIYQDIWQRAKPYYLRGRAMDIDHIEWFMKSAEYICEQEGIDQELLLPLSILHDVGYSEVKNKDYYNLDIRKAHMQAGADIAKSILTDLQYPKDKMEKIIYYISVHDNWVYGDMDIYRQDKVLGAFKDLDWLWTLTEKGFPVVAKVLKKNPLEMLAYVSDKNIKVPPEYLTKTTEQLFKKYLEERKKEIVI